MSSVPACSVRPAVVGDLDLIAGLFDHYRQFYGNPAEPDVARRFIADRLRRGDSFIFLAATPTCSDAGFCQLYPTWCSVAAAPVLVLYDLFVAQCARRQGVGRALMRAAQLHALRIGVARMELQTARTNVAAQSLYESLGWRADTTFLTYQWLAQSART